MCKTLKTLDVAVDFLELKTIILYEIENVDTFFSTFDKMNRYIYFL